MTKDEAITLAATKWWEGKSAFEIVKFQVNEEKLCMPFHLFHQAVEKVVGEPVYTHMFGIEEFVDYVKDLVKGEEQS